MSSNSWLAVIGSREVDDRVRGDIEKFVAAKIAGGCGIVSGGATGADHEAARLAYAAGLEAERFRIYLPTGLKIYAAALRARAKTGKCDPKDAKETVALLQKIAKEKPGVIVENNFLRADETSFFARDRQIASLADELVAFRVGNSPGTTYTIGQAELKGIPTKVFDY